MNPAETPCDDCEGTGEKGVWDEYGVDEYPCPKCDGKGYLTEEQPR